MIGSKADWIKKSEVQRIMEEQERNQDIMKTDLQRIMEKNDAVKVIERAQADQELNDATKIIPEIKCNNFHKIDISLENIDECNTPINSAKTRIESKLNSNSCKYDYDIAFSYASEQNYYVEPLAIKLHNMGIKVFYDKLEESNLWGKDLYEYLDEIYRKKSKYCIIFISVDYARKLWTTHERKSAQARAFEESTEYILPVRFDDTEIPGLRKTVNYIDARNNKTSTEKLAKIIKTKLAK